MKVPKGERLFWSLLGDIGTTSFSYDFIHDNLSSPCVQASIEQWIGDWTCNPEVMGSNLPIDILFCVTLLLYFLSILFQKIFFPQYFPRFYTFSVFIIVLIVHLKVGMNL